MYISLVKLRQVWWGYAELRYVSCVRGFCLSSSDGIKTGGMWNVSNINYITLSIDSIQCLLTVYNTLFHNLPVIYQTHFIL
jgi:hypothetical protein